jgi:hypothetical protein
MAHRAAAVRQKQPADCGEAVNALICLRQGAPPAFDQVKGLDLTFEHLASAR